MRPVEAFYVHQKQNCKPIIIEKLCKPKIKTFLEEEITSGGVLFLIPH
jgi:hypothetical protein